MSADVVKVEAMRLYENLSELIVKKEQLEEEDKTRLSPEKEQQQLVADVKMHNQDISVLDRQNNELEDKIQAMQDELHDIESSMEDQEVIIAPNLLHLQLNLV